MSASSPSVGPFLFYTERRLVGLTGLKAGNLQELLRHLRTISGSCIFHHTHHQFLAHHFLRSDFRSDFAAWVYDVLQERALGEKLAGIDIFQFTAIRQLREGLIRSIEEYLEKSPLRQAPAGQEFHFCRSKSFIMPTGAVSRTVKEFFEQVRHCTPNSLFFHFCEARLRLERPTNDFSQWLFHMGETELAQTMDRLNPYTLSLDELRNRIVSLAANGK